MGTINDYTKIELQETDTDELILIRNGKPLTCPYATRVVVPGQMANTLSIMQSQCGTHCPLFELYEFEKANVSLRCGTQSNFFNVGFKSKANGKFIKV